MRGSVARCGSTCGIGKWEVCELCQADGGTLRRASCPTGIPADTTRVNTVYHSGEKVTRRRSSSTTTGAERERLASNL